MANRYTPSELQVSKRQQNAVLNVIEQYIGMPCPTNAEIAEEADIKIQMACNAVTALIRRKVLKRDGGYKGRILTITATGQSTMQGPPRSVKGNTRGGNDCIIKWDGGEDKTGIKEDAKRMMYRDVRISTIFVPEKTRWRQP